MNSDATSKFVSSSDKLLNILKFDHAQGKGTKTKELLNVISEPSFMCQKCSPTLIRLKVSLLIEKYHIFWNEPAINLICLDWKAVPYIFDAGTKLSAATDSCEANNAQSVDGT